MVKKIIILGVMLMFSAAYAEDEIITGGIKYNEATARIEAFKDLQRKIDKSFYRDYMKDPNKEENLKAIAENRYKLETRELCPFYVKNVLVSYAVSYDNDIYMVFYYNVFGNLTRFDVVDLNSEKVRTIGYSRYGNLLNVSFSADGDEQFVYNANGKLIAHWQGEEMVNKKMGLKIIRKSADLSPKE